MADLLGDDPEELARPAPGTPRPTRRDRRTATAEDFGAQIVQRNLLHEQGPAQRSHCRIGLAQLSLPIGHFEEQGDGLLGIRASRVDDLRRKLTTIVTSAHDDGIDLLLLPELACDLKVSALRADLEALAARTRMTIVAGSHHDVRRRRNVATVFGPESVLWEQEKHLPAILTLDGRRIEEGIRTGPKPIVVANTRFGRLAIVICRDFLDLDLRVALRRCSPPIDVVLNPTFTPVTADFQAAHFEARRSGGSAINSPEKDRTLRTLPAGAEGILHKDVDLVELRAEREKWAELRRPRFIQSTR
jgi:predicted amidohydrolase